MVIDPKGLGGLVKLSCPECGKLCGYTDSAFHGMVLLYCKRCRKQVMFYRSYGLIYSAIRRVNDQVRPSHDDATS